MKYSMKHRIRHALLRASIVPFSALSRKGFLRRMGWFKSVAQCQAVDGVGEPIPWFSYSAIMFLDGRLKSDMKVFEYGSGNSTLWLAKKVAEVISVECDSHWYEKIVTTAPQNVRVHYVEHTAGADNAAYRSALTEHREEFDVVIVDAKERAACALAAAGALKKNGVLIWDDTHQASSRESAAAAFKALAVLGFKRLDFFGMGPIADNVKCTSVFYRNENCLAI